MFKDPNLQLALLENCSSLKEKYGFGHEADYEEFCTKNFGEIIEDNEYEPSEKIESFFRGLDLPKEDLDSIKTLTLDSDKSVYTFINMNFGEDAQAYVIRSLEGIENLSRLETINLDSMVERVSLEPLTRLHSLETVTLDYNSATDYGALLKMPQLKKLQFWNLPLVPESERKEVEEVIEALKQKGVIVE